MKIGAKVSGLGIYLPKKVLTNFDLEKMVETSDEWIRTRTGIRERRIAEPGESSSDLALHASNEALKNAGLEATDLSLIIVATITPDMLFPSTACVLQSKLGANCPAFDLSAACSGFPYALSVAYSFIKSGIYTHVLVVGSEVLSGFIDWKDRSTCVLFGDGAGAAILSKTDNPNQGVLATTLGADGSQADILKIPGGGSMFPPTPDTIKEGLHFLKMQGAEVFKVAVRTMEIAVRDVLKAKNWSVSDIDLLIPHQANMRILQAVADRLGLPEQKIVTNVERYGNMSSASTAVAFYEAVSSKKVKPGSKIVLVAFGAGLTWAATLIEW